MGRPVNPNRKLTMKSTVGSLALKFYGEQLVYTYGTDEQKSVVNGYSTIIKEYAEQLGKPDNGTDYKELIKQKNDELTEYVKSIIQEIEVKFYEDIRKYDKSYAQVICIKHDRDYNSDDVWEPSIEKPHYHLIMRSVDNSPFKVSMILSNPKTSKRGIVEYRKELDDALFDNNGVQTVGDFQKYTVYLTHETEEAEADGKERYELTELISNMSPDEIELIRDGYKQVSRIYVKPKDIREADKIAYELGTKLKSFEDWYNTLPFDYRKRNDMKIVRESYNRGVEATLPYHPDIVRCCVFIYGLQNTGKSYATIEALKKIGIDPKYIYKVDNDGTGKYDNLTVHHKAIVVDDTCSSSLLHLADTKPCKVHRRNNGYGLWVGEYFIVTSNLDFHKWCELCGVREENYQAIYSRFNIVEVKPKEVSILHYATRGDSLAFEVKNKFNAFITAFDKIHDSYDPLVNMQWYLTYFDNKDTFDLFKVILTKYPVQSFELYRNDDFTVDALQRLTTYTESAKILTAITYYYKTHQNKLEYAKNHYCSIPMPSQKELFASLYGYDTTDIDKEFEDLIYDQLDYESNLQF